MDEALLWFTRGEWYAIVGAVLLGSFATELLKRGVRLAPNDRGWQLPRGTFEALGFVTTALAAFAVWPADGLFPHPVFAALVVGATAPTLYKLTTAALRRFGQGWAADILTGERRRERRRVRRERRAKP